ncbi:DUF5134 domain-containing protein [Actinokineospora sp. UTMC 2448]|uniref:DUF5134 domain-containing protein n=1 Tax=Actinokineospora sp. UTMC 2448 TaxID=2268449 RepID=UPI0021647340|nr:DUF5134 domain-containing protein [Actinokineospora sp. UTMC 2448]UVS82420.1 hypothetical protein Actkin_06192 [Actinokineospora sp. UTMC 2448]
MRDAAALRDRLVALWRVTLARWDSSGVLILAWTGVAGFLAVGGYGVARLVAAASRPGYPGCHRAVDVAHVLMGVGMAVMASPVGGPLPMAAWQTAFVLITAWFLGAWAYRLRHPVDRVGWHGSALHHALGAAAMVYMLTAVPHSPSAMAAAWTPGPHTGRAALPLLGWALIAALVVTALPLLRAALRSPGARDILTCGRRAAWAQLAMSAGMAAMLATLL